MRATDYILIVEDDKDDQEILKEVFNELGVKNPVIFFENGLKLISFLNETRETIFLIMCDVNIPGKNGIEIRQLIDEDKYLRQKSIPFVFYSTAATKKVVNEAYQMMIQGYFKKPHQYEHIKSMIKAILDYWAICIHPNKWMAE